MYKYKRGDSNLKVVIFCVLSALIASLATYIWLDKKEIRNSVENDKVAINVEDESENNLEEYNEIAENIFDSNIDYVVGISSLKVSLETLMDSNAKNSWNMGSGIIVSENGYIVTNQHVAGNIGDNVKVTLYNNKEFNGQTKWSDEVLDLAIVKINATGLKYAKLGDSDEVKLASGVYAIGNPLGLDFQRTITYGIVSALNRTIKVDDENGIGYMENLIQTDASINPGNSGGPLIDVNGDVIGINTIKVSNAEGIGFAIPINTIKSIINSFKENDKFEEPYLGLFAFDNILLSYMKGYSEEIQGMLVEKVDEFGPLKNSKIEKGCIFVSIDNKKINNMSELRKYLYTKKVEDKVVIKFIKDDKTYEEEIVLKAKK